MIKTMLYIRSSILLLVMLMCNLSGLASSEFYLKNYTKQEYHAASQNWSVSRDSQGYMYFANNSGLLEFDGITWTLYPSPEGAIVRSVAVDHTNRIFTAGYRELGYWQRTALGKLEYHSLKKEVEENFTTNEEFWNVICSGGKVYFQSFSKIYIYNYKRFDIVRPGGFINSISNGGDQIFVNIMSKGIYEIKGTELSPYLISDIFNNKEIRFIISHGPSQKLIGCSNGEILLYDGVKVQAWQSDQLDYFRKNIINHGCVTADGKIVIGTILDGISIFDPQGHLLRQFNKGNGLQNNTVLGVMSDHKNIWIALDKGIDFISYEPDPSYTVYERKELGAVYSAAVFRQKLYLGTNQGLYCRPFPSASEPFVLVAGTQGQVWDCKVIDDCLFVNHNKGAFEIKDDKVRQISSVSGGFSVIKNPVKPNSLIQSTYSNLIFYKKENAQWKIDQVIQPFNDLIRYLEIDHLGNFWASHLYRGIFRLKLDNQNTLTDKRYYGQNTFGKDHNIHVFKIENRIVFTTGEKLLTYDDLKDTIIDYGTMNEKLGKYSSATRIIAGPENSYWFITPEACGLFNIQDANIIKIKEFPTRLFNNQLVVGFENIVPVSPRMAILCLENGYAILNADTLIRASIISEKRPELRRITISGKDEQVPEYSGPLNDQDITLRYNRNNLQLGFAFPFFSSETIKYQYFIEGLDPSWSEPIDKPLFSLSRVPVGHYKIHVKAVNEWQESSEEFILNLNILPPWYRSSLAYIAYVLLALAGLLLFRRRIIARTRQKESREREAKEHELHVLRNEKLQAELSFKSNELASSTIAIIKKNEFLMHLKGILNHQKEELGSRYPDKYYDKLVHQIDDQITSQDDWKIFDTNFDRAHEQFMKTLKDNYRDLTPGDLRLCAFLRMNLSSKEIAPLMGISFRGVENHRYRLRKKLNLEAEGNLTDFMIRL